MTPAEAHAEAVRRIQDCQGLTKLNDIVGGYAFPMIAVPDGGDILSSR